MGRDIDTYHWSCQCLAATWKTQLSVLLARERGRVGLASVQLDWTRQINAYNCFKIGEIHYLKALYLSQETAPPHSDLGSSRAVEQTLRSPRPSTNPQVPQYGSCPISSSLEAFNKPSLLSLCQGTCNGRVRGVTCGVKTSGRKASRPYS